MPWFVIGITLWVLLLLACWVVLDCSLVSSWFSRQPRPASQARRPPTPTSGEPYAKGIEPRTLTNPNYAYEA